MLNLSNQHTYLFSPCICSAPTLQDNKDGHFSGPSAAQLVLDVRAIGPVTSQTTCVFELSVCFFSLSFNRCIEAFETLTRELDKEHLQHSRSIYSLKYSALLVIAHTHTLSTE